ncbi:peptide deformylase [Nocardia stercoris]|uniref:Peptide deformylase n=1 Tax=Nocardia stercoris TaxID=2483361 RepID=A0A3M2KT17_9NOCA|nr:peptide deformylase [Nocardia stercoris]RMI28074.1 peptide deformylase [Nocardia stercoris]
MTVAPVRLFGDPVLRARADEVGTFDRDLHQLVTDLTDTMHASGGIGMAAPQIGVGLRVFVYDTSARDRFGQAGHVVNPVVTVLGEQRQYGFEGCLSIPGVRYEVDRAFKVRVTGVDMYGKAVEFTAERTLARVAQHETDHLDGVLFLDRLDKVQRRSAMKDVRESGWFAAGKTVMTADEVDDYRRAAIAERAR